MTREPDDNRGERSTDAMFEAVYARLKAMAARQLSVRDSTASLSATVLVHDVYLRINKDESLRFEHDAQFFAYAARAMRHLLCDRARDRMRQRAGGEWQRVTLADEATQFAVDNADQALRLDAALARLEIDDARAAEVVELRYFAGLTLEEIADLLEVTRRTVDRDWRFARAFLKRELD